MRAENFPSEGETETKTFSIQFLFKLLVQLQETQRFVSSRNGIVLKRLFNYLKNVLCPFVINFVLVMLLSWNWVSQYELTRKSWKRWEVFRKSKSWFFASHVSRAFTSLPLAGRKDKYRQMSLSNSFHSPETSLFVSLCCLRHLTTNKMLHLPCVHVSLSEHESRREFFQQLKTKIYFLSFEVESNLIHFRLLEIVSRSGRLLSVSNKISLLWSFI